jgi:hypothetical protein
VILSIAVLVCTLGLCFALGYVGRSVYGLLHLSEVLGVLWILAAGRRERAQLRAILASRGRAGAGVCD